MEKKHVSFLILFYSHVHHASFFCIPQKMNSCQSLCGGTALTTTASVAVVNHRRRENLVTYRLKIIHRIQAALALLEHASSEDTILCEQTLCKLRSLFKHLENLDSAMKQC